MSAVPADNDGARLFRIRVPGSDKSTAVTVRMTDESAWIAIGARHRRLPLTVPEAWALFKALADALDTAGDPPAFLSRPVHRDTK
ncbi:hypothetical protein [Actinocatenispora sera]|uniref:Uncharacterized protein n=1 Tax=Actinocatenispora sera TaxID=390989 RepID=A0A810L3Q3_9ACTN|nr:hypothetical protein [Actinocatenispora sera]BCJ29599.1 hypothetical protein Asera_37070 [Actinocatenispora sera]BCJ29642.1 hypothetical protein Asera_37500 [Actinocatenispora sera]BCJ29682.1 hypothetical protein Asera_37900 [Actinocatenispora sera]